MRFGDSGTLGPSKNQISMPKTSLSREMFSNPAESKMGPPAGAEANSGGECFAPYNKNKAREAFGTPQRREKKN